MSDYSDILEKSWDEIPEPKLLPQGSYRLRLKSATSQTGKGKDGKPSVLFVYEAVEAMDDVDTAELAALGDKYDLSMNQLFYRVWLGSPNDAHRLRLLLIKHGIDVQGMSVADTLKAVVNSTVVAIVQQKQFQSAGELVTSNEPSSFAEDA